MVTKSQNQQRISCPTEISDCEKEIKCTTQRCIPNDMIIQFRPHWKYQGEYGFDWLRVNDIVNDRKQPPYVLRHQVLNEPPYKDCLLGSAQSGHCWQQGSKDIPNPVPYLAAYNDLKQDYQSYAVNRKKGYKDEYNGGRYFISYLNLYPKTESDAISAHYQKQHGKELPIKPPYQAKLRLIANAVGTKPDKVVIEFDNELFSITPAIPDPDNPNKSHFTIANGIWFTPDNPEGRNKDIAPEITITCLKEFSIDQMIEVYAYYASTKQKKLAGKLCVCANDKAHRRTLPMVVVKVKTNVFGTRGSKRKGLLAKNEIISLYKGLYQALIYPDLITEDTHKEEITLNLSNDPNFWAERKSKIGKTIPKGKFIDSYGLLLDHAAERPKEKPLPPKESTHEYLKNRYDKETKNLHCNRFPVFVFGIESTAKGSLGVIQKIGIKNLLLTEIESGRAGIKPFTCVHEVFHGLGLGHAHLDVWKQNIAKENIKFVYHTADALIELGKDKIWDNNKYPLNIYNEHKATDNLMSYKDTIYSTWRWQWQLAQSHIDSKD